MDVEMSVIKRNGNKENMSFDKILNRLKNLGKNQLKVNYTTLVVKIIDRLYDNIETSIIDELTAQQCASLTTLHLDYGILASRIVISNHQKNTSENYLEIIKKLYNNKDVNNNHSPIISESIYTIVEKNHNEIQQMLQYDRDFEIDFFGFKTLERAYLLKIAGEIIERPQHMWMRVALGIHGTNMKKVKETYDLMSQKWFTHATPTLFNSGTPRPQLSSCYLIAMEDDSINGIYSTLSDCASISKWAGGIGMHIHNIRGAGTHIRGTNGTSNGIVPMLKVFNHTARYVDQGGGRRNGSFAIYMEPWHSDIEDFLEMKKNHGDEEKRARDLFYALWIPDLFMERVKDNKNWTLMCPDECPNLSDVYGEEFKTLYTKYENENKGKKTISARTLWFKILDSQIETGTPYMLYKDACNSKSNQKNLGIIKSSNLCTEIVEYSDSKETAVCNLASIGLPKYVNSDKTFNYNKLHEIVKIITENLNKIIDINFYPTEKTKRSNFLHRPIGIGVQGLADVFAQMDIPFFSNEAKEVNRLIFETIYHAAIEKSNELAKERKKNLYELFKSHNKIWNFLNNEPHCKKYSLDKQFESYEGHDNIINILKKYKPIKAEFDNLNPDLIGAYSSFNGSPISKGLFQFDLWNVTPTDRYDWDELRENIKKNGIRNSLLVAPMPTASTSQILGNNECFEPFTSNIYIRRTIAGEFIMVNKYLMNELVENGIWCDSVKNSIIMNNGSIQHIKEISEKIRLKYLTVWEMPMKHIIDMAIDRGPYICQSQSMNLFL